MNYIISVFVCLALGFFCAKFSIDLPSPPTIRGVGLIAAITIGFIIGK